MKIMQFRNKSYKALVAIALCVFSMGLFFQSCDEDEGFSLAAFGPSNVERGGEIYFVGKGLNEVEEIILPNGSVFGKSQFVLESTERITLQIPEDYPLDINGEIILLLSGGRQFITNSSFMVLSTIPTSDLKIEPAGSEDNPLVPGELITIMGKTLKAVDAVVFSNDVIITQFEEITDRQIKFKLPEDAISGTVKLRVAARETADTTYYVEIPDKIIVHDPVMDKINGVGISSVSAGSIIILSGEYFGCIGHESGVVSISFAGSDIKTTGIIEGNSITMTLPLTLPATNEANESIPYHIIVNANGKSVSSIASFEIKKTEISCVVAGSAAWGTRGGSVTLLGESLEAVESISFADPVTGNSNSVAPRDMIKNTNSIIFNLPGAGSYSDARSEMRIVLYSGVSIKYDVNEISICAE